MKKVPMIPLLITICLIVFTSCNSSNDNVNNESDGIKSENGNSEKKIIEPSELISKGEAEGLIGSSLLEGEITEQKVVGQKLCFYNSANDSSDKFLQVGLTQKQFMEETNPQEPKSIYEALKTNFESTLKIVDGVGDEAFIASGGIYIIVDDYYISIGVGNTSNDENLKILEEAGKLAVKNLKSKI